MTIKLKKLVSLSILSILVLISTTSTALALSKSEVCGTFLNYQFMSVEEGAKSPDIPTRPTSLGGDLADKMVVITEEPLGAADDKTTFRCYRVIECSIIDKNAAPAGSPPPSSPNTPSLKRACATYYKDTCNDGLTDKALAEARSKPFTLGDKYKICEPVMVYVTAAGTDLLYYYIGQVYRYVASIGGIIAVLTIIVAGVLRATAGDNTEQVSKSTELIKKCITGLIVLFLSAVILYTINPNFFVI